MIIPERSLIVRNPWIDLILHGQKTWEMRSRLTNIRGRIGLIWQGSGLIVGECNLVDCLSPISAFETSDYYDFHRIEDFELIVDWPVPWVLEGAKRYDTPIPYIHPRGAVTWVNTGERND